MVAVWYPVVVYLATHARCICADAGIVKINRTTNAKEFQVPKQFAKSAGRRKLLLRRDRRRGSTAYRQARQIPAEFGQYRLTLEKIPGNFFPIGFACEGGLLRPV